MPQIFFGFLLFLSLSFGGFLEVVVTSALD